MANAAIYYLPEGFDATGPKVMGRHVAGQEFLRGFARYKRAEELYCFTPSKPMFNDFTQRVDSFLQPENGEIFPARKLYWLPVTNPGLLQQVGCLFLPGDGLSTYAWHRRRVDAKQYSLCGITHTLSSHRAVMSISDYLVAPVQKWDALICTSKAAKNTVEYILNSWGNYLSYRLNAPKPSPILQLPIIPLGVNTAQFAPPNADTYRAEWRKQLHIGEEDVVILFAGRLSAHAKAHPFPMYTALEQAARQTGKKLHLIMAGWFAHPLIIKGFTEGAREICPSVNTIFLEGKAEIWREIWSAADIFCSLSDNIQETFGITPIEAMSAGLPLVVTDWDGYKDTVREGVDGFRIPTLSPPMGAGRDLAFHYEIDADPEVHNFDAYCAGASQSVSVDIAATTKAFVQLIENPVLRKTMGEAGRKHAREVYDWRVVIGQYEALWSELAAIRQRENKLWELRTPAEAANPLYDDPFTLFASYPTRAMSAEDKITLLPDVTSERVIAIKNMPINALGSLCPPEMMAEIISRLSKNGNTATAQEITTWVHPSQKIILIRTLVWFAKMGLVSIEEHNRV